MVGLKKARSLVKYSKHQGLNARMPGYEVKLGYGLHLGWAIEGALGSFYKIDATYLSPNVKMADRMEAGTKIYGVNILLTGDVFDQFTPKCQSICR
jgi:class 3 adenylate cyclase